MLFEFIHIENTNVLCYNSQCYFLEKRFNYLMAYKTDLNTIDIMQKAPTTEPERQYYFMDICSNYVQKLAEELGHKPTCCVTTFGCQMLSATMIKKTAKNKGF